MSAQYSIGAMNQLAGALATAGFSPDEVTKLRTYPGLGLIKLLLNGQGEIKITKRILKLKPFNPTEFFGDGWTVWKGPLDDDGLEGEPDQDSRELGLTSVDFSKVLFETCLTEGEESIIGEEKLRRLKEKGDIRLGGNTFQALWLDYQVNKENSVLEWLYWTHKITHLDFMGLVLRSPSGSQSVLYLYRRSCGIWDWHYIWLHSLWKSNHVSASLASPQALES